MIYMRPRIISQSLQNYYRFFLKIEPNLPQVLVQKGQ